MYKSDKNVYKLLYNTGCGTMRMIILSMVLVLTGCSPQAGENKAKAVPGETREIMDMKGNRLIVPKNLTRVALLGGPTGQVAYILGVQDRLCAVTKSIVTSELVGMFDPSMKTRPVARTVNGTVHIEQLLSSDPQLVIAGDLDGQIVQKKTSIPVAFFEDSMSHGIEDIKKELKFYASVFEAEDRCKAYCDYLDAMIDLVRKRTAGIPEKDRKSVFNGYNANHLVTLGGDTFMQERIEIAGCRNAAISIRTAGKQEGLHSGLGEVSMEQVLAWNPDIIVVDMGGVDELSRDDRWASIKAVKNRQVFIQPAGVFIWDRPSAEAAALHPLWQASIAYPEKFRDISFVKEVQRFYREIFHFNLSEKQARMIENGYFKSKIMRGVN